MSEFYSHTQKGYVTYAGMAIGVLIVAWAGLKINQPLVLYLGLPLIFLLAVISGSLTVKVSTETLLWHFGLGFWKKRIPVTDIEKIEVVRNSWIYGWGIHLTPHGWLYNVSGLRAVQVTLKSNKSLRIGSDEPEALKDAVLQAKQFAGETGGL